MIFREGGRERERERERERDRETERERQRDRETETESSENKNQFFYFRYEPLPSFLSKIGYALHFICLNTKFLFHVSKFVLFDSRVLLKNFVFCPS